MTNGIDKLTSSLGNAIQTVPDLYDDAFKSTTQETGKTLALIPRTINAALEPLRKWIAQKEYNVAETEKLLASKLENVTPEKIVTPEAYVAVPAFQAISYAMDSEELRNLYANLLAKAMNTDTKNNVHPAFVDVIKQLSPIDCLVFKTIMEREINPIINLIYKNNEGIFHVIISHVSDIDVASTEIICTSIDNLIRQGLINIPTDVYYTNEKIYDVILNSNYYHSQEENYPTLENGYKLSHQKRIINKTNFGTSFYNICVADL